MSIPLTQMPGALDLRGASLAEIDEALSADRHGAICALIVSRDTADAARLLVERCWHDAAVIPLDAEVALSQAA